MSRIGKRLIVLPTAVTAEINLPQVTINGPQGSLKLTTHPLVVVQQVNDHLEVLCRDNAVHKAARQLQGTTNALLMNMVHGVVKGYQKTLTINGVGYRWRLEGDQLHLAAGFSHPIIYAIPQGIKLEIHKNKTLTVSGICKQQVGQVAADIRGFKPVEPYKGKGIAYVGEKIRRKLGKTAKK